MRVKGAAFRYRPEYYGQGKVWKRPYNFEGRQQVDKLEAFLTGLNNGRTVPS